MCVCVREREREREGNKVIQPSVSLSVISLLHFLLSSFFFFFLKAACYDWPAFGVVGLRFFFFFPFFFIPSFYNNIFVRLFFKSSSFSSSSSQLLCGTALLWRLISRTTRPLMLLLDMSHQASVYMYVAYSTSHLRLQYLFKHNQQQTNNLHWFVF